MSIDVKLPAQPREKTGTRECRRLRREGRVPGNIYGHGSEPATFSVSAEEVLQTVMAGNHVVELQLGDRTELAMFRDVQWDPFGTEIQHVDMILVNRDERVQVDVPVELRGISPGAQSGGILEHVHRTLSVECPAFAIPESISVRIGDMEIGDSIAVKDLELPDNVTVMDDPEMVVVQVTEAQEQTEEELEPEVGPAEPEVIGRASDSESEDS
ncbi:MAG: 50S ribosomal protein L25 [Planctomycetaceae bacterium]